MSMQRLRKNPLPTDHALATEIAALKHRNHRVEADKAWETSRCRKLALVGITYIFAVILMASIGIDRPFVHALVPTMGYYLSTLSLSVIKRYWLRFYKPD